MNESNLELLYVVHKKGVIPPRRMREADKLVKEGLIAWYKGIDDPFDRYPTLMYPYVTDKGIAVLKANNMVLFN